MLCLDESRQVHEEQPEKSTNRVTVPSILDGYIQRPCDSTFEDITLSFTQNFCIPRPEWCPYTAKDEDCQH